jgi:hypothetical protein
MRSRKNRSASIHGRFLAPVALPVLALGLLLTSLVLPGHAEELDLVLAPPPSASLAPPAIEGFRLPLSSRWKASYGLGLADETALSWSLVRYDQTLAFGTRRDGERRDDWRHFLGLEFAPFDGFSFVGGIAKAGGLSGNKGSSASPTGYERLRLNAGARWHDEDWSVDGAFSFIPTGASRVPSDASFVPGTGGGGSTYFLSLSVSRRF